jgi:threonine aldolase
MIDLYSDTKTRPTPAMRRAMAEAEVGDEQKFEDPTVNRLRERICDLLGTEDAVFLPSGTMCNQIAVRVHCRPGEAILCDRTAHVATSEAGGPAAHAGAMIHAIDGATGIFTADQLAAGIGPASRYRPRSRLVVVEQTSNLAGGLVWPIDVITGVARVARANGLALHMDGARLPNACVASGLPARRYAGHVDSLWIDFTKGLGAPVGAVLAGTRDFIHEAWRYKQMMGGAMRQAGIIAAAALHALDHHWERLDEDHRNARTLADGLAEIAGLSLDPARVETNIVFFEVTRHGWSAPRLAEACGRHGLVIGAFGPSRIRCVTHLDVSHDDIAAALRIIASVLADG